VHGAFDEQQLEVLARPQKQGNRRFPVLFFARYTMGRPELQRFLEDMKSGVHALD
jgi:hypothetical protein